MEYAIIANPLSGSFDSTKKHLILSKAAQILKAPIYGLDITDANDFRQCAKELSNRFQVLIIAGGDGTFSEVLNAVDTSQIILGFLPLGSGNALRYAFEYKGSIADIAMQIKKGPIRKYDLILCNDHKRAFMCSMGIDAYSLMIKDKYINKTTRGLRAYICAALRAFFRGYRPANATCIIDGTHILIKNLLSLVIVKQPYYGFSMKVVPQAKFHDGRLHILSINSSLLMVFMAAAYSLTIGNRVGTYYTGEKLEVTTNSPIHFQTDGNYQGIFTKFVFRVLKGALYVKH